MTRLLIVTVCSRVKSEVDPLLIPESDPAASSTLLEHDDLDVDVGGVNIHDKLEKDCDSTEGPRYIQNACM